MASTTSAKVTAPRLPRTHVHRARLARILSGVEDHRLTVVVAGPGCGKSSALAAWAAGHRTAWYDLGVDDVEPGTLARGIVDAVRLRLPVLPARTLAAVEAALGPEGDAPGRAEALAAVIAEGIAAAMAAPPVVDRLVLVLDDVSVLPPGGASARLLAALCRQAPAGLRVVLAGRSEPPVPLARARGRGEVLDVGAEDLALDQDEVAEVLRAVLMEAAGCPPETDERAVAPMDEADELAPALYALTGGWAAAVRLAAEAVRAASRERRPQVLEALHRPGGALFAYLAEEVVAAEPPEAQELLATVAPLRRFTPALCADLGLPSAEQALASLGRRGVFLEAHASAEGWLTLAPLLREFALSHLPLPPGRREVVLAAAARWFADHGHATDALAAATAAGDPALLSGLLAELGPRLVRAGEVARVLDAVEAVPPASLGPDLLQLAGEARQVLGDWEGALASFRRVADAEGPLPAALAWRTGLIAYLRGDLDEAMATYARGVVGGPDDQRGEEALLLAWTATAHWAAGDARSCRTYGEAAHDAATRSGDLRAQAAAHTALALLAALDGDRAANDAHYLRALDAAERAGDTLQVVRIRSNRASRHLEEGSYAEALAELAVAIPLAEVTGFAAFLGLGLTNRAETRRRLGQVEEALADYRLARDVYQRMGSTSAALALSGLGDCYRLRGDLVPARAAYEEALRMAEHSRDVQTLVPAYGGLARVLACDEPDRARELRDRLASLEHGMHVVEAQLTLGWVALALDDREGARAAALAAETAARHRRDRAGLAEAVALSAVATPGPTVISRLHEALALWREVGDPIGEAATELAVALYGGAPGWQAEHAEQRLRSLGVRRSSAAAGLLGVLPAVAPPTVAVESLGGFRVLRHGDPVPPSEWQSRKARELLKRLVARRGRAVSRATLADALWPDEADAAKSANRLAVALSTLRSVLDPGRAWPADRYVTSDADSVRLDTSTVDVDVERLLLAAAAGRALLREGRQTDAIAALTSAEAVYGGEFLEEDSDAEWALALREEARAAYGEVARRLAALAVERGDADGAARLWLRVLETDPYDEDAHLELVRVMLGAGRPGAARRAYRRYAAVMADLDAEPEPFPLLVGGFKPT